MGGLDWGGLDVMVAYYAVEDVRGLVERLMVLRAYDPKANEMPAPPRQEDDDDDDYR